MSLYILINNRIARANNKIAFIQYINSSCHKNR